MGWPCRPAHVHSVLIPSDSAGAAHAGMGARDPVSGERALFMHILRVELPVCIRCLLVVPRVDWVWMIMVIVGGWMVIVSLVVMIQALAVAL